MALNFCSSPDFPFETAPSEIAMTESLYKFSITRVSVVSLALFLTSCGSPEQQAQKYYDKGVQLLAKRDDLNARVALHTSLTYKADRVEVWRALVGIEERLNNPPAVFQDLRRLVELDPKDLEARVKLARIMFGGGAPDAAKRLIEVANDNDRPYAPLHALRASILARENDAAAAIREAQRALDIDPQNVDANLLVAAKKASDGDVDGALAQLARSSTSDPSDQMRLSLEKIQILVRKGDTAQAEGLLRKLITDHPKDDRLHAQLVQLYLSSKRFDDAERELRSIAVAAPSDTRSGMNLVRFLLATKGAKSARDELNERIKIGGDVFDYQVALADLDFAEGNLDSAAPLLKGLAATASSPERKLLVQSKLAEMYVNKGNFAAAEPIVTEILQKDGHNTTGLRLRAAAKIEKGDLESAIADLRLALNDQPKSVELLTLMGVAYERSGKNELANRQYADALKASNLNPDVAQRYLAFLQRQGDLGHAEDVLGEVVARNPTSVPLLTALAQTRLTRKNFAGALAVADALAKLGNNAGIADQIRASVFANQNRIDDSVAALERAHAASPDAFPPVVGLVTDYVKLGKPEKAEGLLQELLKKYPDNAELLILMGQTKLAQNKFDDAQKAYRAAIAKQPKDPNSYSALSDLFVRQKDYGAAVEVVQAGLREQPQNLNLLLVAAGLQIQTGKDDNAIAQYEAILKNQPNSLLAINNLASLLLDHRSDKPSIDRAAAMAEKLKGSTLPQFEDTVGWAQFKKGDPQAAVATLEVAATKLPDLAAVHYHLGMSYAAIGKLDQAKQQFQKALALEPDGTPLKSSIRAALN
jgi:cellulose synthase operon protein C